MSLAIIGIILLIAGNAFFVAAEFGLVSARRTEIELQAQRGSQAARLTLGGMERLSLLLAAAQFGITLCSLGLGAIGEPFIEHLLESPFHALHVPEALLHPLSIAIALVIMTYLHVVFGEMIPKNIALAKADRVATLLTPPLLFIVRIFYPVIWLLNGLANMSIRALGITPLNEVTSAFTLDEVAGFVEESHREGLLTRDEERLLRGSLEFDETRVTALIIPLEDLTTASSQATPADIEKIVASTGFSRLPITAGGERLAGYVHLKDLLEVSAEDYTKPIKAREVRQLPVIKPGDSLQDALRIMQQAGAHMGQVINNRRRLLGVVMLEDALEELVGEIHDISTRRVSS